MNWWMWLALVLGTTAAYQWDEAKEAKVSESIAWKAWMKGCN